MVWRYHGIPFFHFHIFFCCCLEETVKRTLGWERISSRLWSLFQKCHSENYLISAVFKVLNNDQVQYWKTPYIWRFYRHESKCMSILSWINIMKRKWAKMPWKLLVVQKSEPFLWRSFARHFSYYILLSLLKNPSF